MSTAEPSSAWPVIGHLHLLQGKVPIFRILASMADKLGPVFVVRLRMFPTLVVSNHEVVKESFTTNKKGFASHPNSTAAKILGYNYVVFAYAVVAISKLKRLLGATVASDVIPFLEWVDLKGHLSSMKHI